MGRQEGTSVYLFYSYKCTNTDTCGWVGRRVPQFTCFTRTKVRILTPADGSAGGYLYETVPPMKVDHRTGQVI
jgi:hypothetical protein